MSSPIVDRKTTRDSDGFIPINKRAIGSARHVVPSYKTPPVVSRTVPGLHDFFNQGTTRGKSVATEDERQLPPIKEAQEPLFTPEAIDKTPIGSARHVMPSYKTPVVSRTKPGLHDFFKRGSTCARSVVTEDERLLLPPLHHVPQPEAQEPLFTPEAIDKTPIGSARYLVPLYKTPVVSRTVPGLHDFFSQGPTRGRSVAMEEAPSDSLFIAEAIDKTPIGSARHVVPSYKTPIVLKKVQDHTGPTGSVETPAMYDKRCIVDCSCTGPTGATGPTGPSVVINYATGPKGPRGPKGLRGPPGPPGESSGGDIILVTLEQGGYYPLPPSGVLATVLSIFLPSPGTWMLIINFGITNNGGYVNIYGVYPRISSYYYYNEYSTPQIPFGVYSYQYTETIRITGPRTVRLQMQINYDDPDNVAKFDTEFAITRMSGTKIA